MAPTTLAPGKQILGTLFYILLYLQISGWQFALWPQLSDGSIDFQIVNVF